MLKKTVLLAAAAGLVAGEVHAGFAIVGPWVDLATAPSIIAPTNGQSPFLNKPSSGVVCLYAHSSATGAQGFTIVAKHTLGTRTYSASNESSVFVADDSVYTAGKNIDAAASFLPPYAGIKEEEYTAPWKKL